MRKLDAKEQRFVDEYLVHLDPKKAAIDAGYSKTVAASKAYQWVSNSKVKPHVYAAIKEAQQKRSERTHITADRVLQELARIAFFDPRKLLNDQGHPKSLTELDDDTAAAVAGLDLLEEYRGEGKERQFVGYVKKFKIADKNTALTNAMRHLGLLKDKVEMTGKDGAPMVQPVLNVTIGGK